ncbi:MAG TPA: hypothetical protein VGR76_00355 [Candidatus Angelobacter sp.]|jgi:hypothetical protein|nr:hypothetical protein [Candidatus Angelobacter sp.]
MIFLKTVLRLVLILAFLLMPAALLADTNCEEGTGPLNTAQPQGLTPQEIIQKFAAREEVFRQARNNYVYTQDITVQELDGNTVSGEFRLVQDITYDDKGVRQENVTYAPQSSLRQLILSREDYEDFRSKMAFIMTTSDLPQYNLLYVGQQKQDEIDTYVFDTAPKTIVKGQRYFQGRIWVDNRDFQIVKSCGKTVPEAIANTKKKKNIQENLSPKFVTYREQIDGQYWFPTYIRADDTLHFRNNDVHMREIIKLTNYKRFGSKTKIIFKGEAKDDPKDKPKDNPKDNPTTPEKKP